MAIEMADGVKQSISIKGSRRKMLNRLLNELTKNSSRRGLVRIPIVLVPSYAVACYTDGALGWVIPTVTAMSLVSIDLVPLKIGLKAALTGGPASGGAGLVVESPPSP